MLLLQHIKNKRVYLGALTNIKGGCPPAWTLKEVPKNRFKDFGQEQVSVVQVYRLKSENIISNPRSLLHYKAPIQDYSTI